MHIAAAVASGQRPTLRSPGDTDGQVTVPAESVGQCRIEIPEPAVEEAGPAAPAADAAIDGRRVRRIWIWIWIWTWMCRGDAGPGPRRAKLMFAIAGVLLRRPTGRADRHRARAWVRLRVRARLSPPAWLPSFQVRAFVPSDGRPGRPPRIWTRTRTRARTRTVCTFLRRDVLSVAELPARAARSPLT